MPHPAPSWQIHTRSTPPVRSADRILLSEALDEFLDQHLEVDGPKIAARMESGSDPYARREVETTIDFLATLILDGTLDTWSRPFGGGPVQRIPVSHWEVDDQIGRFASSTYAADEWANPDAAHTHWVFVGSEKFEAFMNDWFSEPDRSDEDMETWSPEEIREGAGEPSSPTQPALSAPSIPATHQPEAETPENLSGGERTEVDPPTWIRLPKVMELTGLPRSTIYQWIAQGRFPDAIRLGTRFTVWDQDKIFEWLKDPR